MIPDSIGTLDLDAIIPLFTVTDFNLLSPQEAFRFCNYTGVVFEGDEYAAIGCQAEGYDLVGQGAIANPTIKLSNVGRVVSDWLYKVKNEPNYRLEGCTVTRVLTQKKFLDGQPNQNDSIKTFTPDIFQLNQVTAETYAAVEFTLSTPFDIENLTLPSRPALRSCSWLYRSSECGYTGNAQFTINNVPTLDPSQDQCNKSLAACKLRFGAYGTLNYGGYPSLGSFS